MHAGKRRSVREHIGAVAVLIRSVLSDHSTFQLIHIRGAVRGDARSVRGSDNHSLRLESLEIAERDLDGFRLPAAGLSGLL